MKPALLLMQKWMYLLSTIVFWGITSTGTAQCGGPSFPPSAEILANVPEASGYNLVYDLPVPTANQAWASQADVPYSVNNSAAFGSTSFTRVAYYVKLESTSLGVQWVWVSMNAFTNDIGKIGVPTGDIFFQQQVTGMNVLNYAGVNRTGVAGNVEFWSNCYNPANASGVPGASDATADFGDAPIIPGDNCYGSMQVHDFNAMETLLAYNGWAYSGFSADDLGIGNCSFCSNPDWTVASNANFYDVKEIYVFVNSTAFQPTCNNASLTLNASGNATLTPAMVTTATVGTCGVQNIQLSKSSFSCADAGSNTVTVTFTVNGNTSTCNATVSVADVTNPVITASGTSFTLSCNPSAAAIEAALGTAIATDNCGTPALSVNTPPASLNAGTYTQTRTWTATDGTNTATTSRTVTWPSADATPVITPTGTTLTLGCNPTAAAIEAALGTATATSGCGTPSLSATTTPVVLTGNTYSRTRTWTAVNGTNTSTASRTVSWPKDVTAPVITPTGTTLTLGCNPTAAAIEAALGTATATDNCGSATLTVTTFGVVSTGNNRSQTRTWTATDGTNSSSESRIVTWTVNCTSNSPHTYPSKVSCKDFNDDASPLMNVCYKAENRKVKKVSPKHFYYYTNVTAPATLGSGGSFYVDIVQTKSCPTFNLYEIQGNQVRAYDTRCKKVDNGSEVSEGQGRVRITGATPGRVYTISVKYETKSLEGSTYTGNVAPVCENNFVARTTLGSFGTGTVVPGSQGMIKAMPGCYNEHDQNDEGDDDDDDDDDRTSGRQKIVSTGTVISVDQLSVTASPNPSAASFSIAVKSNETIPVSIRVVDVLGKLVYSGKIVPNNTMRIGAGWNSGTYFVEVLQGNQRSMIRLVKQ